MAVNATYIASAPDIFTRMAYFSSETGYIYGHGIVVLVALTAAYQVRDRGSVSSMAFGCFWGLLTAFFLFLAGWESSQAVIFLGSALILIVLISLLEE